MSHPTVDELVRTLETNRRDLRAAIDAVPIAHRERRPADDRWSVTDVVEHIAIVERRIATRLGEAFDAAHAIGLPPEVPVGPAVDRTFIDRVGDRTNRFKTGPHAEPKGGIDSEAAWAEAAASRAQFLQLLERARGLNVDGISAPHPYFGPLSFYQWAAFLGGHDARHAAQIREIAAAL